MATKFLISQHKSLAMRKTFDDSDSDFLSDRRPSASNYSTLRHGLTKTRPEIENLKFDIRRRTIELKKHRNTFSNERSSSKSKKTYNYKTNENKENKCSNFTPYYSLQRQNFSTNSYESKKLNHNSNMK